MMAKQTEVTVRGRDNLSAVTKISNLSEAGPDPPLKEDPEEEVDGREAARALQTLQKLAFLKIIFLDIGISLGDVVTDLVQGLSLIFEGDWGLAPTAHYGAMVVLTCWLPGPLTLLHLCLHQSIRPMRVRHTRWGHTFSHRCWRMACSTCPNRRWHTLCIVRC